MDPSDNFLNQSWETILHATAFNLQDTLSFYRNVCDSSIFNSFSSTTNKNDSSSGNPNCSSGTLLISSLVASTSTSTSTSNFGPVSCSSSTFNFSDSFLVSLFGSKYPQPISKKNTGLGAKSKNARNIIESSLRGQMSVLDFLGF